ncbi:MAG: SDR family NAD(P)-dependent oxidoreductase [Chloroflexota bacterium]
MTKPIALVTGASTGFGKLIAEQLVQVGYTVYGTSRRAQPNTPSGIRMCQLELTAAETIQMCIQRIVAEAGQIDLLVNNAGRFHEGLLEETPVEEVELLFQTNFFGLVRVNNAVLPIMRQQKRGRIILMGSLAGLVGVSGMGYTSAVKHALEGYAETLYTEVKELGIQVTIIEPSYFKTEIYDRWIFMERDTIPDYDILRERVMQALLEAHESSDDPTKVAQLVTEVATASKPRLRYPIGPGANLFWRLKRYLPEAFFLRGLRSRVTE